MLYDQMGNYQLSLLDDLTLRDETDYLETIMISAWIPRKQRAPRKKQHLVYISRAAATAALVHCCSLPCTFNINLPHLSHPLNQIRMRPRG